MKPLLVAHTTGLKLPDAAKKQALLDFVQKGKGIVGIHAATVFQDPGVLRFCLDGIQFGIGDLAADASPR